MKLKTALLLPALFAAAAAAQEPEQARVRDALFREAFEEALGEASDALEQYPGDSLLARLRAEAIRGIARDRARAYGHQAAAEYLEGHLTHELLAVSYGEASAFCGREVRALGKLRACDLPLRDRIGIELRLLAFLGRWGEAAQRARELGWREAEAWAQDHASKLERLEGRRAMAGTVVAVGLLCLLGASAILFRLAPPRPASS